MKIVLRGGCDITSEKGIKESFWYEYSNLVQDYLRSGKSVAIVTLAKPDSYYDKFINEFFPDVIVINGKSQNITWNSFDIILLAGGDSLQLLNRLKEKDFSLNKLKVDGMILGDSGGAYVLSSYFYHSPPDENRGIITDFYEGFNPEAKVITVAHTNNPVYTNQILLEKVNAFAKEHNLAIVMLEENQEKILE